MVLEGHVRSIANHGGNTTRLSLLAAQLDGKRQEILMELLPNARHMATIFDAAVQLAGQMEELKAAAHARNVELSIFPVRKPEEVATALQRAITLAAAGEGQIKEKTGNHLFRLIRKRFSAEETNLVVNWLKHASGPYNAEITEQEAVVAITRAIQKFVGSFEATHPDFEKFSEWAMQKGYTNKPMTEKAK